MPLIPGKMMKIELKGFKELEAKLRTLGDKIAKNGLRSANYEGAKVIKEAMIAAAPVDTGLLKESIAIFNRRGSETMVKHAVGFRKLLRRHANTAANRRKGRVGKKYSVDSPAFYARFVEYGTSKWPEGKPFMRRSFLSNTDQAIEAVRLGLVKAIERAQK